MAKKSAANGVDFSILKELKHSATNQPAIERPGATWNEKGFYDVEMKRIEEDPNQPRREKDFNEKAIGELAESIKAHTLLLPISLRNNPEKEGNYIVNYGARRYRAFMQLDEKTIPATFDDDYSKAKQVVENVHRQDLGNTSILGFFAERVAEGKKAKDISAELNKSLAWTTKHMHILKAENTAITEAFTSEKIKSFNVAYDLTVMAKKSEQANKAITRLIAEEKEIDANTVKELEKRLANPASTGGDTHPEPEGSPIPYTTAEYHEDSGRPGKNEDGDDNGHDHGDEPPDGPGEDYEPPDDAPAAPKAPKMITFGMYKEEAVTILTNKEPTTKSKAVIKTADGNEKEVPIKNLTLLRIWAE